MKICIKCKEEKEESEFYKRSKAYDGLTPRCKVCAWVVTRSARNKNKEKYLQNLYLWRKNNPERVKELMRKDYVKHRAQRVSLSSKWAKNNRAKTNAGIARWKRANPHKVANYSARRRTTKMSATPAWANQFFIEEIYDLAQRRTKATGFLWHVDHIVPLKNNLVCGLHVEHNLQVIPASHNMAKGNRHWPDMSQSCGSFEV